MDKLQMESVDNVQMNIEKIQKLFPNAVTEVKRNGRVTLAVDFDVLKQELSSELIDDKEERYQMTWPDKKKSILLANTPVNKTLRPCKEESVDFDNTQNLYFEGDNLDVLKLLQETYLGKIKMIYIDPPYNTGNDFVYNDDFAMDTAEYADKSGQYNEQGDRLVQNTESNGRFHTDWLNMIYSRLKVAKDLLSDDGVIFISIDDNEQANLKKICDEIFGETNKVSTFIWHNNKKGRQMDRYIKTTNEYILLYAKNINCLSVCTKKVAVKLEDFQYADDISAYKKGYPLHNGTAAFHVYNRPNLCYTIYYSPITNDACTIDEKNFNGHEYNFPISEKGQKLIKDGYVRILPRKNDKYGTQRVWRWGMDKFRREYATELMFVKETNGWYIYQKDRVDSNGLVEQKYTNYIDIDTSRGKSDINVLFDNVMMFDFSKPTDIVKLLSTVIVSPCDNSIILDFFSGSATTAHAVMQLNAEDGGNRKFIMVQLPEKCDEKSEAYKAGYKTICDIGKERIRRAGTLIKKYIEEVGYQSKQIGKGMFTPPDNLDEINKKMAQDLDVGFRVLKLDSSNMKDVYYKPSDYSQNLLDSFENNIKEDRTPLDLLFQIMLDLGKPLSAKIEEKEIAGKQVFIVDDNDLIACFDKDVTEETVTAIAKLKPLYAVLRDSGLSSDSVGANFDQIFATYSPNTTRKVL